MLPAAMASSLLTACGPAAPAAALQVSPTSTPVLVPSGAGRACLRLRRPAGARPVVAGASRSDGSHSQPQRGGDPDRRRKSEDKNSAASAAANDRRVFDLRASGASCSLQEAREAKDTCSILNGKARDDCYASFGCSSAAVDSYLDDVLKLEEKLPQGPDLEAARDTMLELLGKLLVGAGCACLMLVEVMFRTVTSFSMSMQALFHMASDSLRRARGSASAAADSTAILPDDGKMYTFDAERLVFREYHGQGEPDSPDPAKS